MKNATPYNILRHFLYKTLWVQCLLSCALYVLYGGFATYAQTPSLTIAIVQPLNIKAYHEAVEGFLEQLGRHLHQDFNTVIYESPQGLYSRLEQESEGSIDLILTVGNEASADVSRRIANIPIVFAMVLNPESVIADPEKNIGASVDISIDVQLKMIKEILPMMKKVGVIYDPTWNAGVIDQGSSVAKSLQLDLIAVPITSQKDIPGALKQVREKADVLLGIVDNTVYTSGTAKNIIEYTHKNGLPFVGISEPWVKAGALWSLYFDNKNIGRQAADLAGRILSGTSVRTLSSLTPTKVHLALNLRTADLIGVEIPENITQSAIRNGTVYE